MSSVFVANLTFEELGVEAAEAVVNEIKVQPALKRASEESKDENLEPSPRRTWEYDVGDSCCFGTRTVRTMEFGMDCVWRMHGGV